jgi:hypothetical protein
MSIDYYKLFTDLVKRSDDLSKQRDTLDVEIEKIRQLIVNVFPMLPPDKQRLYEKEVAEMDEEGKGLLDAIKLIFSTHKGEWLSASKVSEYLIQIGFDFRHYRANPLTSISTTLRRLVPEYLDRAAGSEGNFYKRRLTIGDRVAGNIDAPPPGPIVVEGRKKRLSDLK